jgi:hypothetical protein
LACQELVQAKVALLCLTQWLLSPWARGFENLFFFYLPSSTFIIQGWNQNQGPIVGELREERKINGPW